MNKSRDTKFIWRKDIEGNPALLIKIPLNKYNIDDVFKAELALRKVGISFDTGTDFIDRDWEFDWSLHNPNHVKRKNKK